MRSDKHQAICDCKQKDYGHKKIKKKLETAGKEGMVPFIRAGATARRLAQARSFKPAETCTLSAGFFVQTNRPAEEPATYQPRHRNDNLSVSGVTLYRFQSREVGS